MADIRILLAQAAEIIKKEIAVVTRDESITYPEDIECGITYEEACSKAGKNCKGWNIYMSYADGIKFFVCVSSDKYYESQVIELLMLLLGSTFEKNDSAAVYMEKAVEGKYDAAELVKLEENLSYCLPGYMLLVDNFGDSGNEVIEILVNTMNVKISLTYDNRIIAVADEENIEEACSSFIKNVLSELLIECKAVIGGRAAKASELHGLYENCIEALCLMQIYSLGDSVVNYESMYGYRAAYNLNPKLKESIRNKVFTAEFTEIANGELGITIEEFFRNNLNLTDTAAKLFIHRNTLLYRLEKIQKCTGFDLKRFEDSWLFKLAWMIHKEKSKIF